MKKIYPLHAHTSHSKLDAVSTVEEYLDYCLEHDLGACSCTDHGYVSGWYDLITLSNKKGIKPIPGVEAYLYPDDHTVSKQRKDIKAFTYYHLTLWAMDMEGFRNLRILSNKSWQEGRIVKRFSSLKPCMTWGDLEKFNEGIVAGTGCIMGPVNMHLTRGEHELAEENLQRLISIFSGRLFVEVMPVPVNKSYDKTIIEVESMNGTHMVFHPGDMLLTEEGEISALKAYERGCCEISASNPRRRGQVIMDDSECGEAMSPGLAIINLEALEIESDLEGEYAGSI